MGGWELRSDEASGEVWGLAYICPCGCGDPGWLPFVRRFQPHDNHTWEWDGNRDLPTLQPSIRRTAGCHFHGYLQGAVWSACPDGPPIHPSCWRPQ